MLIRINQITRGWANYFKHAIAQRTFSKLQHYTWCGCTKDVGQVLS